MNQNFNAERRQQFLIERDALRRESVRLAGEIEELETEKVGTDDEAAKKRLAARIAAKKARQARVDQEIETLNGELTTLNAPSGTLKATEGGATFDPEQAAQERPRRRLQGGHCQADREVQRDAAVPAHLRLPARYDRAGHQLGPPRGRRPEGPRTSTTSP